jgi:hypothetical protein
MRVVPAGEFESWRCGDRGGRIGQSSFVGYINEKTKKAVERLGHPNTSPMQFSLVAIRCSVLASPMPLAAATSPVPAAIKQTHQLSLFTAMSSPRPFCAAHHDNLCCTPATAAAWAQLPLLSHCTTPAARAQLPLLAIAPPPHKSHEAKHLSNFLQANQPASEAEVRN